MPKIDVNKVAEILKKNELEPALLRRVLDELRLAVQPDPSEEDKPPPIKKQFVILVSDPEHKLPKDDFVGWVLQIPEEDNVGTTPDRICRAAYDFNDTKKGSLLPVSTIGETLENVPAKHFKEYNTWVKTKEPVLVVRTDNQVPKETVEMEPGGPL
ncbi:hypothetical protein AXK12_06715 [Cephaloticoccus capnophilus]|uniref:Uncharacterized protein n=1 Tax=Cephaloticoccus capnophilus TaxID=1548208 RepID=A0A139SKA1_9BACT|nr:hypothetical protein [Cephaloticoccus capnophilus]KXU34917.1 hypothetical protein AXK12_06715 [Cephaloticoccus capnophilus]